MPIVDWKNDRLFKKIIEINRIIVIKRIQFNQIKYIYIWYTDEFHLINLYIKNIYIKLNYSSVKI